jgi:hypothetical protein
MSFGRDNGTRRYHLVKNAPGLAIVLRSHGNLAPSLPQRLA